MLTLLLLTLSLAGCATLPPPEKLAALPTVELGQPAPAGNEYILHIVAGKPTPFKLDLSGDVLVAPAEATTTVVARHDIYLYKYWASLDGKNWKRSHELFKTKINFGISPDGGKAEIQFDQAAP